MDVVTLAVACGLASQSPLIVTLGMRPDCVMPAGSVPLGARVGGDGMIDRWAADIAVASHRFGIPEHWVRAIMRIESGGVPSVTSPAGAMGLMQIMPSTWAGLHNRYGLGADPYLPHDNIIGGVAYLRELLDRYGSPDFIAAYNAGPERLDDHLLTGRPLPGETRRYLSLLAPQLVDNTSSARSLNAIPSRSDQSHARELTPTNSAASNLFTQPASPSTGVETRSIAMSERGSTAYHGATDVFDESGQGGLFIALRHDRSGS